MIKITVQINDGAIVPADHVRVYVEGIDVFAEGVEDENNVTMLVNFTDEGLIIDLTDPNGINCGTRSVTYEEEATVIYDNCPSRGDYGTEATKDG